MNPIYLSCNLKSKHVLLAKKGIQSHQIQSMCHEIRRKKSLRWHYPLCADCYITPHAYIGVIWTAQVKKEDKHVSNLWSPLTVATQIILKTSHQLHHFRLSSPARRESLWVLQHIPSLKLPEIKLESRTWAERNLLTMTCSFQKTSIFSGRSPQKPSIFHQFGAMLWWFRRTTEVIISEKVTVLVFLADLGEANQYFK